MTSNRSKLLERAENARRESKFRDFKREFAVDTAAQWCELVKDIVAFANSGGGVIVFGVGNDGSHSGIDVSALLRVDAANITNKIESYSGCQFSEFETLKVTREGRECAALMIGSADVPIVFTRPGADVMVGGKQKPCFAQGTVYFRHGAKSEPGNRDDLRACIETAIERVRKAWLGGIRKVVEAPAGHVINVVSSPPSAQSDASHLEGMAITANISASPGAVRVVPQNAEELWPHRQKDLLELVNKALKGHRSVNGHDILCINTHLHVLKNHPEFAYKPHHLASPQYSNTYAEWIIEQHRQDPRFFERMRDEYKRRTR